jgi:hypothetical protein
LQREHDRYPRPLLAAADILEATRSYTRPQDDANWQNSRDLNTISLRFYQSMEESNDTPKIHR